MTCPFQIGDQIMIVKPYGVCSARGKATEGGRGGYMTTKSHFSLTAMSISMDFCKKGGGIKHGFQIRSRRPCPHRQSR